jgi:hypothetical protein
MLSASRWKQWPRLCQQPIDFAPIPLPEESEKRRTYLGIEVDDALAVAAAPEPLGDAQAIG